VGIEYFCGSQNSQKVKIVRSELWDNFSGTRGGVGHATPPLPLKMDGMGQIPAELGPKGIGLALLPSHGLFSLSGAPPEIADEFT
jgi:hypothetical protein